MKKKRIAVIDGQGGGIGGAIIKELKKTFGETVDLIALGTNSIATSAMLGSGANRGATGENAIAHTAKTADYIVGTISVILANSMLGELTEKMAVSISSSPGKKFFIPVSQESVEIIGVKHEPLPHLVKELAAKIKESEEKGDV